MSMTQPMDNRGGNRPTAPQNNPMNVNPLGGNGQSGNIDYSGFGYGMNKTINEQRQAAPIVAPTNVGPLNIPSQGPAVPEITAPTAYPDNPIGGAPMPTMAELDTKFNNSIQSYAPVLTYIASQPDTSQETRDVLAMLLRYTQQ